MKNWLWRLLLALFALGADAGDGTDDGAGDGADPGDPNAEIDALLGEGDDDDALDALPNADDDTPPAKPKQTRREIELEAENRTLRETRQPAPAPAARTVDVDYEREEAELDAARKSGDAAVLKWTQFHVNTSRAVRNTERASTAALARAEALLDKTQFERLEITKPGIYKRYATKVEEAITKLNAGGSYPSRQLVLRMLIGEDIMKGDVKGKAKAKSPAAEPGTTVPRGRAPATRGDVNAKTRLTDHQKRIERLRDQVI